MTWLAVFGIKHFLNIRTDVDAHGDCTDIVRESAPEVDSGRKVPRRTGDTDPRQYCTWLFSRSLYLLLFPLGNLRANSVKVRLLSSASSMWTIPSLKLFFFFLIIYSFHSAPHPMRLENKITSNSFKNSAFLSRRLIKWCGRINLDIAKDFMTVETQYFCTYKE